MSEPISTVIPTAGTRKKHVDSAAALSSVLAGLKSDCALSSRLLQTYNSLLVQFVQEGITQHSQLLLRKIALKFLRRVEVTDEQAIIEVVKVSKALMMNELEIVGWSIYLTRMQQDLTPLSPHLTFTGVAAKYYFDDDIQVIQAFLEKTIPSFSHSYNEWFRAHCDLMRISPKELNERFKELSEVEIDCEPKVMQDYNFLVEEILQFNPAHAPPEPVRFAPIVVISHTKPEPEAQKVAPTPQEEDPLPLDDLKLARNASTGSMSDFQNWAPPGLEKFSSITEVCPGFWDKATGNWGEKPK